MEPCSDIPDDPAQRAIAAAIDNAQPPKNSPLGPETDTPPDIILLGSNQGVYFFISTDGEQRALAARDLTRINIVSLFCGDKTWLCKNFPLYNPKTQDLIPNEFHLKSCQDWIIRKSGRKEGPGLFNPETPLRRLGVWRARDYIVGHFGDNVWYQGRMRNAGCIIDSVIYPACSRIEEPDFANPANALDGQRIRQNFNAWSFSQAFDADLLFGYLGAALLGSFPQWRVHALVTGERGTGKSTLARYLMDAIGEQGTSLNEYTEAGVRQKLANESRTLHLDEGESGNEEQAHRMHKVIGLLRKMSDGAGARIVRGTSGGTALNSVVTGCVFMTAINAPPLQPQDRSRILTIPIDKPANSYSSEDIRAFRSEASGLSRRLRSRALLRADQFAATFDLYRKCLMDHGCDARQSDLFSTLLAGQSILLHDEIPSSESAAAYVAQLRHRLHLIMVDDSETSDGQACLNRLLDAECAAIRDGIKRSIGQLVADGIDPFKQQPENDKLIPLGIRIVESRSNAGTQRMLFVANDHIGLKRIFHNTPWADGNWRASLRRLSGVAPAPQPVSVGRKARGLLIPKLHLPGDDDGNEVDISPPSDDPAP